MVQQKVLVAILVLKELLLLRLLSLPLPVACDELDDVDQVEAVGTFLKHELVMIVPNLLVLHRSDDERQFIILLVADAPVDYLTDLVDVQSENHLLDAIV